MCSIIYFYLWYDCNIDIKEDQVRIVDINITCWHASEVCLGNQEITSISIILDYE